MHALTARLWPYCCVLCGRQCIPQGRDLCADCEHDLPRNLQPCEICAEPLPSTGAGLICGACLTQPPHFDACFAPYLYAYPLDRMIRGLKYGGQIFQGRVLGELFAQHALERASCDRPQLLLPVPLGRDRFRKRGYNQAAVLAEPIARRARLMLRNDVLVRTRETLEQAGLDRQARQRNLARAFALRRPLHAEHVALFDDVLTTGSTTRELARVLKRAGAKRVDVWCIARAARASAGS